MWALVVDQLKSHNKEPLRIGWITGDLSPHPVSRFLLGFFPCSQSGKVSIIII